MKHIKFCGIRRDDDVNYVNQLLPDYIGMIFYEKSHRNVTENQAKYIKEKLSDKIKAVGVFVDKPYKEVAAICDFAGLDLIQLHGNEDYEYITSLKKYTNLPIIKAVRYQSNEQLFEAEQLPVDFLLVDTYSKEAVGGTGKAFDWSLLPKLNKPYFLAGGIDGNNLQAALNTDAYCIDVSSGIETDKVKDFQKMKAMMDIFNTSK